MRIKLEDEEQLNSQERYEEGGFVKVPIENNDNQQTEISNKESKFYNLFQIKSTKKTTTIIICLIIAFIIVMITKNIIFKSNNNDKLNNKKQDEINKAKSDLIEQIKKNLDKDTDKDTNKDTNKDIKKDINQIPENLFYITQNKEEINLKSFSSNQLRNPQNIKLIEKLEITLDLEYKNFVHLKIKDASMKRWELPESDVLNKDYLNNKQNNTLSASKNSSIITSNLFNIELNIENKKNEFSFKLINDESLEFYSFSTKKQFLYSDTYINFQSKLTSDNIYGFGERTHDFKLNKGIYTIWPHDCGGTKYDYGDGGNNQYSHQPIGLHKTKFKNVWLGFVFLNTNAQDVVISNEDNNSNTYLTHKTIGGIIDYYIIVNNSPEEVVKNIQFLLGIPPLPPYWSFGYHQSRYGYKNFNEFKNVYEKYKQLNITIDTMWIDIDSLDKFEIFTIDRKFKDMPSYVDNTIHKDGGKFVPIVDLGISYENMRNPLIKLGNSLDIFIKSNYTKKPLIGKVWPGKTVFPDFLNPKIKNFWFTGLEDYYRLIKYDGIWLDMNEPANLLEHSPCIGEVAKQRECTKDKNKFYHEDLPYLPGYRYNFKETLSQKSISENAILYGNRAVYDVKPLISFYQTKYTYEYLDTKIEIRPFVLSRSTSIGSGKYTFHWLGDNFSKYDNIKFSISGIFNFNIFGIPFTGSDICGFMENANQNLCVRWYNLGVFYPFSRNHNFFNTRDQYPWSFGEDGKMNIIKKDINYRYSLLRYMYSQFFLISLNEKGSFFKPLMFEFPEEKASYEDIESKIMFGESFLLCTFYGSSEGVKKFNLPNSNFNEYPSGKSFIDGGKDNNIVELSGKLDKLYLFLRGGAIVPSQNTFDKFILNSLKLREEKLNLIINPNEAKQGKGVLFFDNDNNDTIMKKTYYRIDLTFDGQKLEIQCNKNNLEKYNYNDHIIGKIEIWRVNELFNIEKNKQKPISLNIHYANDNKGIENIEGIYDKDNNKIIYDFSKNEKNISIFDISEILFKNN